MSITKGALAERVLKQIGVNTRTAAADPVEVADCIDVIDQWITSIDAVGVRLGYNLSSTDPTTQTGLPDWALQGVVGSVALLMTPYYDKQPSVMLQQMASSGMAVIYTRTAPEPVVDQPAGMPVGTGNHMGCDTYFGAPPERVITVGDFLLDGDDNAVTTN